MEDQQKPPVKFIAYNYGLYLGLLGILNVVILYLINEERNTILSIVSLIATTIVYYYGISAYKKTNQNLLSVKDSLRVGLGMAVIGGIIGVIYTLFHYNIIQPDFTENLQEKAMLDAMEKNPNMSNAEIDVAEKMINIFTSQFFISTMYLIASLFFGFIISLILGLIMKRE